MIFSQSRGGGRLERDGRGGGWGKARRVLHCQSFKAQGDTLNNGAPVPAFSAHATPLSTAATADFGGNKAKDKVKQQRNGRVIIKGHHS